MNYELEDFKKQVSEHVMEVTSDNGVNRHIRFRKPGTMCMHFDLITWPGYLCYTGDMGTYVFSRLRDMFTFFRKDSGDGLYKSIDMRYWAEKVQAQDKSDGIKVFSETLFDAAVKRYLVEWLKATREITSRAERRELWQDAIGAIINTDTYLKRTAIYDYSHRISPTLSFYFEDFEANVEEYSYRFKWCCYALAWGINQYDQTKEATLV